MIKGRGSIVEYILWCRIRVAAAASTGARASSIRRLTGQKGTVSD